MELTDEVLGKGAWGEVKVAKFRGLRVATKVLHDVIISEYNQQLFAREMAIAAKIRHPNLLLFIGATREGEAIILTELMPTSLRRELEKKGVPRVQITSIAQDGPDYGSANFMNAVATAAVYAALLCQYALCSLQLRIYY